MLNENYIRERKPTSWWATMNYYGTDVPIDGAIAHLDVHMCAGIALAATTCTEDYNNFKTMGK